jgi:ankyrin repeat protein
MEASCLICLENHCDEDGIRCSSGHFICNTDIDPYLSLNVFPHLHKLKKNGGKISCPNFQCEGTFDPIAVFVKMSDREKSRFISIINLLSESNKRLNTLRSTLHEVLVLRCPCPGCKTPVDPFPDACSAVMCLSCGNYYCNFCFEGFSTGNGEDNRAKCHTHVAEHNTTEHKDPFLSAELVKSGQLQVQLGLLCNCLKLVLSSREYLSPEGRHVTALAFLLISPDIEDISSKLEAVWEAAVSGGAYPPRKTVGTVDSGTGRDGQQAVAAPAAVFGPPVNTGAQQLANAIKTDNRMGCMQILQAFEDALDVNYVDPEHRHPLTSLAVLCRQIQVAGILLERGADVTRTSSSGRSILYIIAEMGSLDVLKLALQYNPTVDVNARVTSEDNQYTMLHVAVRYNHAHLIPYLIEKGANINPISALEHTPLSLSIICGNKWSTMELLRLGANPTIPNAAGRRPMYIAIEKNDVTTVELLLTKDGVGINDPIEGIPQNPDEPATGSMTALHIAALLPKSYAVVSALLAAGADLNIAERSNGHTPLVCALLTGNEECAMELMRQGADVKKASTNGRTAMYIAIEKGMVQAARALVSRHGIDVNDRTTSENIDALPLTLAVLYKSQSMVAALLELGADGSVQEMHSGNTPLMCAVLLNDYWSASVMLAAGADPTVPNMQGRTPLFGAAEQGNTDTIGLLVSHDRVDINAPVTAEPGRYCAIHVATLMGHRNAVSCLLALNADKGITDAAGRTAADLASGKNDVGLSALLL